MIANIIERAAQIVADGALKSFVILAVAGLVVTAWRNSSASSRHLVWTAGVLAAIAVPVLTAVLPRWSNPAVAVALPASSPVAKQSIAPTELAETLPASNTPIVQKTNASEPVISMSKPFVVAPVTPMTSAPVPVVTQASSRLRLVTLATLVWLTVAAMILLPFLLGRIRLLRIARTSRRVTDVRWIQLLSRARASDRFTRPVTLLESDDAAMPMTWGIFFPVLLVPSNTAQWPEWKCRNILLHELAHIERFDCLTQFIARIACALYWFNPIVWVAAQRMRIEREMACDDRVINNGSLASDYAGQLLDVARSLRPVQATAHAAIAMARPSQLSGRLTAVLDRARNRSFVTGKLRVAIGAATLAVALPVASFTPWTSTAEASTIVHASMVPSEIGISPAVATAPTESRASESLPPMTITARFANDLSALSKSLTSLSVGRSFAASGAAFPIIKAVQSSDAVLGFASPTATTTQAAGCWENRKDQSSSVNINSDDSRNSRTTVKFSSGDCSLELRSDGQFRLRPDLSDVEWLESGGQITIEEREGRSSRRVEIRSTSGGLDRIYYENGQRREWDSNARAWLASTLMAVERRTAFAASTRVPQIYAARGAKGVMDEVSLMPSDYAKSAYLSVMLKQNDLDASTLTRTVQQATREMTSDYYLAEVFTKVGAQRQADEGTWRAFADATRNMKSDYYKSEVIGKVLSRDRLDSQTIGTLLTAASTINSDYYQAETLKKLSQRQPINAQTRPIYLAALSKITSDYYKGEVLSTLSTADRYDAATTAAILKAITDMKSDYYKEQALVALFKRTQLDASTRPQFFSAVRSIDSDYYKQQALDAALDENPLTRETVAAILAAAPAIKSDAYLSSLLTEVARRYTIDDKLRPAFDRAVDAIHSDHYRGSVLNAARGSTR